MIEGQESVLKCLLLNACSIRNKINELEVHINNEELDIIAVTETWLTEDVLDSELLIPGFTLYRKDRFNVRDAKGGGVLVYINSQLVSIAVDKLNSKECESLFIQIGNIHKDGILFGICYRSNTASDYEIEQMLDAIATASSSRLVVVGDFNYPNIDWDELTCDAHSQRFFDIMTDSFLVQHVLEPTRQNNVLDLVFSSEKDMIDNVCVLGHLGKSDHCMVQFDLHLSTVVKEFTGVKYCLYKGNYSAMRKFLQQFDWDLLLANKSAEEQWVVFKSILQDAMEKFIPKQSSCRKKRKNVV